MTQTTSIHSASQPAHGQAPHIGHNGQPPHSPAPASRPRGLHRFFNRLVTVAFLAAIALPLIGTPFGWELTRSNSENRAKAPLPRLPHTHKELRKYSDAFFAWFADNFAFRNTLIKGLAHLRYATVGASSSPKVIIGPDNWLFIRPRDASVMRNADGSPGVGGDMAFRLERNLMPFTDAELQQWQTALEKRHYWLASNGIPYLLVIPPEKQTIYPEYLPDTIRNTRPTRLDQLLAWMKARNSPVRILDLRPALLKAKKNLELYRRTDSHWNDEGAYIAYREILNTLRPLLPEGKFKHFSPAPRSEFIEADGGMRGADLSALLSLEDRIQERWPALTSREPTKAGQFQEGPDVVVTTLDDPELPSLYLNRDSFSTALMPYFRDRFRRIYSPLQHFIDERQILKEKPDLVVTEFVERKLYYNAPMDTQAIDTMPIPPR